MEMGAKIMANDACLGENMATIYEKTMKDPHH